MATRLIVVAPCLFVACEMALNQQTHHARDFSELRVPPQHPCHPRSSRRVISVSRAIRCEWVRTKSQLAPTRR